MKTIQVTLVGVVFCGWAALGCGTSGEDCTPNAQTICKEGVTYWTDSCGNQGDVAETCQCGCNADYSGCKDCECVPDCAGKCCGDDGCEGTCTDNCAATGQTCNTETCICEGECHPMDCSAQGKECGTWGDGCDGTTDCGGCPDGQVCSGTGQCEGGCIPACENKDCGDDGCGGECGTCLDGWACSNEGKCIVAECGGDPLTIQGDLLTNVADVQFDTVVVGLSHKRDIDEYEDGCITNIEITLTHGSGCQLQVVAGGRYIWQGGLVVQSIEFSADSFCPNFPDPTEGTYTDTGGMVVAEIVPGVTEVPGYNVPESCVATTLTIRLEGALAWEADGTELVVSPTEIVINGEFLSYGDTATSCPCLPDCEGKECGDDGCGMSCGTCTGMTDYCSADGHCLDDCTGRQCGPSPNEGHDCGTCDPDEQCVEGACRCGGSGPDCVIGETCCGISCVDLDSDNNNCGICGNSCGQNAYCTLGSCTCNSGFDNCDVDWDNGCEIDITSDLDHCGTCNNLCRRDHASEQCVNENCSIVQCDPLWDDCDSIDQNGCETSLETLSDCGSCDTTCSRANATASCSGGSCHIQSCIGAYRDCDGFDSNGCEIDTDTDLDHCGSCNTPCRRDNASEQCFGGGCTIDQCDVLWDDCDGVDANGCETSLETLTDCGSCETACSRANAVATCDGGSCQIASCDSGWDNCDGIDASGCEVDLLNDVNNCGTCGYICSVAGEVCYGGSCCMPDCTGKICSEEDGCGALCGVCTGFLSWVTRAGGNGWDYGQSISTLSDGSSLVTGRFGETATFGPGEPNETMLTSVGSSDVFVARYNPDGTLAWARSAGGSGYDTGLDISTLSDGSSVVTGYFKETATFGKDEANETILPGGGLFVARYNPDGTLAWAKLASGGAVCRGYGISTLSDGSSVVTGVFVMATFGPGEANETTLISAGGYDVFVAKYNPDGTLDWARRAGGGSSGEYGSGISTLSDGSSVVTGVFRGTATFGPGEANETTLTSAGSSDTFIARYNPDGTLAWARSAGGSDDDSGSDISTLSDGSSLVTGQFAGTAVFGPGEANETSLTGGGIFVARYNPDGTLVWARSVDGLCPNDTLGALFCGISTLTDGSSVVTGYVDLYDVFVARYSPDGTLDWARSAGGSGGSGGYSISTLSDGSSLVTGYFTGTVTFGPSEANETTLVSADYPDIFVMRLDP